MSDLRGGSSDKLTWVHVTEYPPPLSKKDVELLRSLFRVPNRKRLAKVKNLKRCPRRRRQQARSAKRSAKRNTIVVLSTPRQPEDEWERYTREVAERERAAQEREMAAEQDALKATKKANLDLAVDDFCRRHGFDRKELKFDQDALDTIEKGWKEGREVVEEKWLDLICCDCNAKFRAERVRRGSWITIQPRCEVCLRVEFDKQTFIVPFTQEHTDE